MNPCRFLDSSQPQLNECVVNFMSSLNSAVGEYLREHTCICGFSSLGSLPLIPTCLQVLPSVQHLVGALHSLKTLVDKGAIVQRHRCTAKSTASNEKTQQEDNAAISQCSQQEEVDVSCHGYFSQIVFLHENGCFINKA